MNMIKCPCKENREDKNMLEKISYSIGVILKWLYAMTVYGIIGYIFMNTLYRYIFIGY